MPNPYFQQLFADRIGGAMYGKDNAIYKFEKIKRANRKTYACISLLSDSTDPIKDH